MALGEAVYLLTTTIGAYPKPDEVPVRDWFTRNGGTDSAEPGAFPAPPNQNASVRDLAIQPESGSAWAVGAAPSGRSGVIWAHSR